MTYEMIVTLVLIVLALILFASVKVGVDVVSIGIITVLVISGVLSAEEAVKGFANSATLTVAAMFVISDALIKTGIIKRIASFFSEILSKGYAVGLPIMSVITGTVSAFINNTPVVATFIPIVSSAANERNISPAKYLIPLSYSAIFGGTCTLIGTSTNLLISGIAQDEGVVGLSMFSLAPLGLVFFVTGVLFLVLFGRKLIPIRTGENEKEREEGINNFLCEIVIAKESKKGITVEDIFPAQEVLMHKRDGEEERNPSLDTQLMADDILLIKGNLRVIRKIIKNEEIYIKEYGQKKSFEEEKTELMEIVILPNSIMEGKKLKEVDLLGKYNAGVLAIRHRGEENFSDLDDFRLTAGDILLIQTNEQGRQTLLQEENAQQSPFLSMSSSKIQGIDRRKLVIVISTLITVIGLAAFNLVPIMIAAFGGIVVLALTHVITMQDAYRAIDWKVIFLLAGTLSLGAAMSASGLTAIIGDFFREITLSDRLDIILMISSLYFTAALLTEIISNNATAALLAPIVIEVSADVGIDTVPLLLTIAFACSSSFMTPVSYQTNAMVYSAGTYKYTDFARVGLPLKLIFWAMASILIPYVYLF